MPLPTPPVALKDHRSVIYDDTLYTYQVDAFQSLELKKGAEWTKLPMGVPSNGSTCVLGNVNGQDSLYVVGGVTKSSQNDYAGLQRYTFKTGKWESLTPQVQVTKDRLGHGSAFLASSSQILIYSGSQDNSFIDSTQTFLVSLNPPYNVLSFESAAPPVMKPLMMPYNASHALMLGGESTNSKLYTFSPADKWKKLDVGLASPLQDSSDVQATILQQKDGSKILEIFDMHSTPNQISTLLLQNATSSSRPKSAVTHASLHSRGLSQQSRKRKRGDASPADRPAYNSTLAPQISRVGFSLASGDNGLVVLSGGGGNSQDVLTMFNETSNQWIDTNAFFDNEKTSTTPNPTSAVPSQAASSTAAASSSAAARLGTSNSSRNKSLTILGATLGTVFGIAVILILILLLLRHIRRKRVGKRRHHSKDYTLDSKRSMDFADRGSPDMISDGGRSNHQYKNSDMSGHSAYVMGAPRAPSAQSHRKLFHKPTKSDSSAKSFFGRSRAGNAGAPPPMISEPFPISSSQAPQLDPIASPGPFRPQSTNQLRSEPGRTDFGATGGWSKYWANGSATNISPNPTPIGIGSGVPREASTYTSSTSGYTASQVPSSKALHSSAEVDPLNVPSRKPSPPSLNPARSAGTVSTLSAANATVPPPINNMPWPPPNTRTLSPGPFPGYPSNARPMSPTRGPLSPPPLQTGLAVTSNSPPHRQQPNMNHPPPSPVVSDMDSSSSSSSEHGDHNDLDTEEDRYQKFGRSAPQSWTPIDPSSHLSNNDPYFARTPRPVSSVYSKGGDSVYYAHPGEKVRIPNFPGVPSRDSSVKGVGGAGGVSRGPSKGHAPMEGISEGASGDMGMRTTASRDFGVGEDSEWVRTGEVRRGVGGRGRGAGGEDMSWLILGGR